jgi:opacity protein-like surface antigen
MPSVDTQGFDQYGFMANGYVDLGTFVGFTPYVGAGAGVTRVAWKLYNNDVSCVSVAGNVCGATSATDRTRIGAVGHPSPTRGSLSGRIAMI